MRRLRRRSYLIPLQQSSALCGAHTVLDNQCTMYVHWLMADLRFSWDPAKARANQSKHGVSFEEAETVFSDENAILLADPEHSASEERFILLGLSVALRTLVVVHCQPDAGGVIRLISARRATRSERGQYATRWSR